MPADAPKKFNTFPFYVGNNVINLASHTYKAILLTSAFAPNAETQSTYANVSAAEVANGNGYTTGGQTVAVTWTRSTGTVTWDIADPAWTASGGSITARYLAIYDDTPTSPADPLVCYVLLDNANGGTDVTVTAGNTLTVQIATAGLFSLTGM